MGARWRQGGGQLSDGPLAEAGAAREPGPGRTSGQSSWCCSGALGSLPAWPPRPYPACTVSACPLPSRPVFPDAYLSTASFLPPHPLSLTKDLQRVRTEGCGEGRGRRGPRQGQVRREDLDRQERWWLQAVSLVSVPGGQGPKNRKGRRGEGASGPQQGLREGRPDPRADRPGGERTGAPWPFSPQHV